MKAPFFSIIIPTRDRPALVELVLKSLEKQHLQDFEVIVSDNFLSSSCLDVCKSFTDKINLKYMHPERPLSMADNYEYALSLAQGEYLLALEDKAMLLPSALSELRYVITQKKTHIINFYADIYEASRESLLEGNWRPLYFYYPETQFHPFNLLRSRVNFPIKYIHQQPYLKIRNKVLFGCWSMNLVKLIQRKHTLFQPISPDYTSMALGAIYSETAGYDMGRPLALVLLNHQFSNGALTATQAKKAKMFFKESDINQENEVLSPFKECHFIQSVSLAIDFLKIIRDTGMQRKLKVNVKNLSLRACEELEDFQDLSEKEKNYYRSKIPKPSFLWKLKNRIHNYFYIHYHPKNIWLYICVNILGRFGLSKKYKAILEHRRFVVSYLTERGAEISSLSDILDNADAHYNRFFKTNVR